ncbi:bacteriohemerythrin [Aquabacterium sp. OR-4]|uniref:bacteriohemerythrin n=1 Tax=Aquabacterium sp. OR-4 TaxID=2978127 RepID=UPI0021B215B3|nr:bacteriohemerythrin [Aquabacterium sp. OR-4]MDT7835102.1 bacteriohemerythrin [Aquabacterium sp. OR-4]
MTTSLRAPRHAMVVWTDEHALGLDELDAQHRLLFDLTNDLWHHLVRRSARTEVLATLTALERYALSHFSAEETFMRVTCYPHIDAHTAEHAEFIERVSREKTAVMQGHALGFDLLSYLKNWLTEHILRADKDFAHLARACHPELALPADTAGAPGFWRRLRARW